eukprot:CAMPEP_0202979706 /NCGR_PEP_ID=MMETSP1396-20130829/85788_1 /ASSEMBLY_ACC=CAM_ASM_000872 /TAXON_ID= /ORGANISM="Pseudokeronopsis sp., Strain Brazil" /LENGTH=85 /DNA_ID=CAMNT_0049719261 /DNA_START=634 /DNA_END=891 /DNA_ORIENTATION=+
MKDMKNKLKEKLSEIEVLKEMIKSANMQAKAKDIDISRLQKRIQRLEKMTEISKAMPQEAPQNYQRETNVIKEASEFQENDDYLP